MNDIKILTELLDAPIAFNPAFARIVGNNLAAGMLLSQLFYWAKAKSFGEFYKVSEELQKECFLGRTEFENARKKIIETGIFTLIKKGVPCKSFYTINLDVLFELLSNLVCTTPTNQYVEKQQSSLQETNKLDCTKPANKHVVHQQTIINNREYTETTTENINNKNSKTTISEIPPESELKLSFCNNSGMASKNSELLFDYTGFDEPQKIAIETWFVYRKEAKKTYKTKSSLTALRNKMLELKASGLLVEAINHSIANEYTGLFPPSGRRYAPNASESSKQFNYVHDFRNEKPGQQVDTF